MAEKHAMAFDYFDLSVTISDTGEVAVRFHDLGDGEPGTGKELLSMSWDELREVVDFAAIHGLAMKEPYVVEYADTREAIEA